MAEHKVIADALEDAGFVDHAEVMRQHGWCSAKPQAIGAKIYIWDNGEDFLDHSIWFVESDLEQSMVEDLMNAAIDSHSRRGGVVAVLAAKDIDWRQMRLESLSNWFTCYGNELVNWRERTIHESIRRLPLSKARELSYRLYPSNSEIIAECMGFDR